MCSGGDLNPPLGFYFPLFSMSFAREFPSGWKSVEMSGSKCVVICRQSTYKVLMCFDYCLPLHMLRFWITLFSRVFPENSNQGKFSQTHASKTGSLFCCGSTYKICLCFNRCMTFPGV